MAGLSVAASAPGWESSIQAMRSIPREVKTQVSRRGRTLAEPLAREIRAAGTAQGSHAASVARTAASTMKAGVPGVRAGGKPYTMGSEWGGRRRRTTYYSTSRLGRRYLIVQRRTTMQFRAFRGHQGYWFHADDSRGPRRRGRVPGLGRPGRRRAAGLLAMAAWVRENESARPVREHQAGRRDTWLGGGPTWPSVSVQSETAANLFTHAAGATCTTNAGGATETLSCVRTDLRPRMTSATGWRTRASTSGAAQRRCIAASTAAVRRTSGHTEAARRRNVWVRSATRSFRTRQTPMITSRAASPVTRSTTAGGDV